MLHVLRHYIPLRKAILIVSETVLLTLAVVAGMSSHLWSADDRMARILATASLDPEQAFWRCLLSAFLVAVLAQIALSFNELYDFRVSSSRYERASRFLGSAGSAILLVTIAIALTRLWEVERVLDFPGLPFAQTVVLVTGSMGLAFVLLYVWRNVFHSILRRSRFNQRVLILGSGRLARRITEELEKRENSGFDIVAMIPSPALPRAGGAPDSSSGGRRSGERRASETSGPLGLSEPGTGNPWFEAGAAGFEAGTAGFEAGATASLPLEASTAPATRSGPRLVVSTHPPEAEPARPAPASLPGQAPLSEVAERLGVSDVVVAFEDRRGGLPTDELLKCRMNGIVVQEAEAFFESLTGKIPAEGMRPSYLIFNRGFVQHPMNELAKRCFDIVLATVLLIVAWPIMLAAAIAIRLDSSGPILFRQERSGQGGRAFVLFKFRSMREDAEKLTGPVWAQADDPRVTRVGRFLRDSRVDELPQLFNVLAGTMSFVGPRPERPTFVEELAEKIPYYNQRLTVKPGLTGWAQINYPYGNTVEDALQKLQYDLFYIKYQSFLFDLSILFNTIKTILLRKGT